MMKVARFGWMVAVVGLVGCTDYVIMNPLKSGSVQPNRAFRRNDQYERFRQVPANSFAQEARIATVDPQQICFDVTIRSVPDAENVLDVRTGELQMSVDGKRWPTPATLTASEPMARYVPGLVPHYRRVQTLDCVRHSRNYCIEHRWRWHTRTTWRPGNVEVAESAGRACWAGAPITVATKKVGIKVTILRKPMSQQSLGDLMMGGDAIRPVWNWEFKDNAPQVVIHEQAPATAAVQGPPAIDDSGAQEPTDATHAVPQAATQRTPKVIVGTEGDTLDVLTKDGRFGTFVKLLQQSGLASVLVDKYPHTVLAPTDAAFAALGDEKLKALTSDPERLKAVLSHQISNSVWPANQATGHTPKDASRVQMYDQQSIAMWSKGGKLHIGEATSLQIDLRATNGYIHVFDRLIE